jgi:hypothetical protein
MSTSVQLLEMESVIYNVSMTGVSSNRQFLYWLQKIIFSMTMWI